MAHLAASKFINTIISEIAKHREKPTKVLEIGSHDVNGSIRTEVMQTINVSEYIGIDLSSGPGVDVVGSGHEVALGLGRFDWVISSECLEHNPFWKETLYNMRKHVAHDGFVIVSCATLGRVEHGTARTDPKSSPGTSDVGWNYYMNLEAADFPEDFLSSFKAHRFWTNEYSRDLYFVGGVVGLPNLEQVGELFTEFKPTQSLMFTLFVGLPLAVFRRVFSEKLYQEVAVRYLKLGRPFKKLVQ